MINDRWLVREPEKLYELQYSSFAIPPSIYNFKCYWHLERMRESYAFAVYFVITDSLFFCLLPVIISTFSLVRFIQELQKSNEFCQSATGGGGPNSKQRGIWSLSRTVFALDGVAFLLCLILIFIFTIYWLIIDPNGVFLFETAHYLNCFFVVVVNCYFLTRKFGNLAKIIDSLFGAKR